MQLIYGYFTSEEVTPKEHLGVIDLSNLIPENISSGPAIEADAIMYADEFGVLRYAKTNSELNQIAGSPIIHNSSVSISNKILPFTQDNIDYNFTGRENEFEQQHFCHSVYVSTNYTLLPSTVAEYIGLERSSYLRNPSQYNIKIVDNSGKEDENVKYKILLERYTNNLTKSELAGYSYQASELYRIIVLFDYVDPKEIYLVYDKYEMDEDGIPYNPHYSYKEKVNAVPYYQYVAEESEVVDPSSLDKRFYSTQLFSYKENSLLKNRINNDGWKIYTPRKAIQDPRTFQNFNWRLISKINYNFSQTRNVYSPDERPYLNVGVLYSGSVDEVKNAYVFSNLERSNLNIQKYLFNNPNANPAYNKSQKNYWLVDIDNLQNNYSSYDLLIWTPTRRLTEQQQINVETILSQNVSVVIDFSQTAFSLMNIFGFDLQIQSSNSGYITIDTTYKNADTTMGAWNLSSYEETSSNLTRNNVTGKRREPLNNNSVISIPVFTGTISQSSRSTAIVRQGDNAVFIKRSNPTGNLFPAALIITACPFFQILNDVFSADGSQTNNNGGININTGSISSDIVTGPNKLFYNIISDVSKTKVNNYAKNNTNNESTVLWTVSPWRNSWTINGELVNNEVTVLTQQEKETYNFGFKNAIGSTSAKFCRQIGFSLEELFRADFEQTPNGGDAQNIINQDCSNVEFYLECTNKNVEFLNFVNINSDIENGTETLIGQVPLQHSMFKISTTAKNQIINRATVSIDAVSKVYSPSLRLSDYSYPFIITNTSEYQERIGSNINTPRDLLPGSQVSGDYSFSLKTQVSITEVTKIVDTYKITWTAPFTSLVSGEADFRGYIIADGRLTGSMARTTFSVAESPENKIKIDKNFSPFDNYNYPTRIFSRTDIRAIDYNNTSYPQNSFHYTGDIDEGNRWDEYFYGKDSATSTSTGQTTVANTFTTNKGALIPQANIRAAILIAKQASGLYKTSILTATGGLEPSGIWATLVWTGAEPVTLSELFHKWLNSYAISIFGVNFTSSQYFNYYGTATGSFVADKFLAAYPAIHRATQTVSSGSTSARATASSVTRSTSTTTYRNGYSKDFVEYIQYTLSNQNYDVTINGNYDKATSDAVMLFQRRKSLGYVDAIVDSQTKSVLATYWLSLAKENNSLYEQKIREAPRGVAKYIRAAIKYSDIANIGTPGKEYRRISFTGVPGPTEVFDSFIVKIPRAAEAQKVHNITISTGAWPAVFESVYLYEQDFDVKRFYTDLQEGAKIPDAPYRCGFYYGARDIKANSSLTVDFDTFNGVENIRYAIVTVKSKKLSSKYGPNAEGFSISDIKFSISADGSWVPPKYGEVSSFSGSATGQISGYTVIESAEQKAIDFANISTLLNGTSTIESIKVKNISFEVTEKVSGQTKQIIHTMPSSEEERFSKLNNKYEFTQSYPGSGNVTISVNPLTQNLSLNMNNATTIPISTAQKISSSNTSSASVSDFSITQVPGRANLYVVKTTNGIQYDAKETFAAVDVSNYYIADADQPANRQNTKLTINVKDGVVILVNSQGAPAGFPNFNSYQSTTDRMYGFGFVHLLWGDATPAPYGLDWQFLHITSSGQRIFLGKKISYSEYLERNSNGTVYIGLNVFDADMDSATTGNIVGDPSRNSQLVQIDKPTR